MVRQSKSANTPRQVKLPLLQRAVDSDDQMTTSSQTTSRLQQRKEQQQHHHHTPAKKGGNSSSGTADNIATRSTGKRRLRLFGALTGSHNNQYTKPPTTPTPSTSSVSETSSHLARGRQKYDTRPIYPQPSTEGSSIYSMSSRSAKVSHSGVSAAPLAPSSSTASSSSQKQMATKSQGPVAVPPLPTNQRDSKPKVRPKADPPTREEVEAAKQRQQPHSQKTETTTARQADNDTDARPGKRRTSSRQPTTTTKQPVAANNDKEKPVDRSIFRNKPKNQSGGVKETIQGETNVPTSTNNRPQSVLKNHQVIEEKKVDDMEHLVAGVVQKQAQEDDPIRTLLSRPLGRQSLPISVGRNFVVEVSSAEWDADEERWKYRILVQQRPSATTHGRGSFTTAYTWRSLSDFGWLEEALRREFHGALLVPLLNMAIGVASVSPTTAVPVEAESLRHWLTDLLNGIRGQGEWLYLESCSKSNPTSIWQSEAMEIFLYRTGSLTEESLASFSLIPGAPASAESSLVLRLAKSIEQIGSELCVGPLPDDDSPLPRHQRLLSRSGLCASNALASAPSLEMNDSFGGCRLATGYNEHPVLLMYFLLKNYRETGLLAMEKLSLLRPAEETLGVGWKRMAIALTNLFAYEKDVETAKLGDLKVKRENMPFRKVQKSHVDDGLRILSRFKVERNIAALDCVKDFLSALLADFSAVGPSVEVYKEVLEHLERSNPKRSSDGRSTGGLTKHVQRHSKEWLTKTRSFLSIDQNDANESQVVRYRERLDRNGSVLQDAMANLIRHLPVRMARIAWRYWQTEISQVADVHKAASSLRDKLNVVKEESITRMMKRHYEDEKADKEAETGLVQRMLHIGRRSCLTQESPDAVQKREEALKLAKERLGRWDIKLGMAIMEAIGIDDPNIRVEETTRDLRLVRKYAIGLRECLNRCVEAVGGVRAALLASEGACRDLREARKNFFVVLSQLFSGKVVREDTKLAPWNALPVTLQHKIGVTPTADPFQWSVVFAPEQQARRNHLSQNSVGNLARDCLESKDSNTAWLLSCMSELLNDYQDRVQQVESYVYMECVGIQLERHFSERRAAALAAFEKKTDITTAINVARKKKLPKLVDELQRKLDEIGNEITQTSVREAKELHLESKQLKSDIHELAVRQLERARETSTERAVALISLWAKEEEASAAAELKSISEAISALEKRTGAEELEAVFQGEERIEV